MGIEILRPELALLLLAGLVPVLACAWGLSRKVASLRVIAAPRHLARLFPALRARARGDDVLGWLARRAWIRAAGATLCAT